MRGRSTIKDLVAYVTKAGNRGDTAGPILTDAPRREPSMMQTKGGPGWVDALVIGASLIVMLIWSWGTWPDPLVDFGRELYTPWQLTQGQVLYRDVQSFYGPLSPYVNALWFTLFGVSLQTLVCCNLGIMVLLLVLVHRLMTSVSGRLSATIGCLVIVFLFGFAQLVGISNYNYLCPYSHEAFHGLTLSLAALFALGRFMRTYRSRWAAATGAALGLVFLTKPESFVACTPAVLIGLCVFCWRGIGGRPRIRFALGVFAVAMFVPPLAAFVLLRTAMDSGEALRGVLGSWPFLHDARLTTLPFFKAGMGTNDVGGSIQHIGIQSAIVLAVLAPITIVAFAARWFKSEVPAISAALFTAVCVGMLLATKSYAPSHLGRPLPLFAAVLVTCSGMAVFRSRRDSADQRAAILRMCLGVFALALLAKMIFAARVFHYGFVLAMPATLLVIPTLVQWIPRWIDRHGGAGSVFRAGALAVVVAIVGVHVRMMNRWWEQKTAVIGRGDDRFRTYPGRADVMITLMRAIESRPEIQTMTVLPEGVMINYLMRIPSPCAYLTFLPTDLLMFGEDPMLKSLKRQPPDAVIIIPRDLADYGQRQFGQDYAQSIAAWIEANYVQVETVGTPSPDGRKSFGAWISLRNNLAASGPAEPAPAP